MILAILPKGFHAIRYTKCIIFEVLLFLIFFVINIFFLFVIIRFSLEVGKWLELF